MDGVVKYDKSRAAAIGFHFYVNCQYFNGGKCDRNANLILMLLAFPPCYETDEGQEDKVGRANIQTPNSTNASLVPRAGVEDRERAKNKQ